jgi:hypothetical protein
MGPCPPPSCARPRATRSQRSRRGDRVTSPNPGMTAPNPRTWAAGDFITTPRLRGDMTNFADLFTTGRPLFLGTDFTTPPIGASTVTLLPDLTQAVNTWSTELSAMPLPLAGWYLVQGNVSMTPTAGTPVNARYAMGFHSVINGAAAVNLDGGVVPYLAAGSARVGGSGADLYQFNPGTADTTALYAFTTNAGGAQVFIAHLMYEWVALPTSGLTNYPGPYGTVVASPAQASAFPPGTGTTLNGSISAGATSMVVTDATGMVTGGSLGLEYMNAQPQSAIAEVVTITSVAGTTIGISATAYAHASGVNIAVPVGSAFLNQQCRDAINFLVYPPLLRTEQTSVQSIPSQVFPAATQITSLSSLAGGCVDNFTGFSANVYTAPVAGLYYVYGQVYYAGSAASAAWAAGIRANLGTIQWGTRFRSDTTGGAVGLCCTVRRHLRLAAGDQILLYGSQNSGAAVSTIASGAGFSKLICLWRAF